MGDWSSLLYPLGVSNFSCNLGKDVLPRWEGNQNQPYIGFGGGRESFERYSDC